MFTDDLYSLLQQDGMTDLPESIDAFSESLKDEDQRKGVYDYISSKGYGDSYEDYSNALDQWVSPQNKTAASVQDNAAPPTNEDVLKSQIRSQTENALTEAENDVKRLTQDKYAQKDAYKQQALDEADNAPNAFERFFNKLAAHGEGNFVPATGNVSLTPTLAQKAMLPQTQEDAEIDQSMYTVQNLTNALKTLDQSDKADDNAWYNNLYNGAVDMLTDLSLYDKGVSDFGRTSQLADINTKLADGPNTILTESEQALLDSEALKSTISNMYGQDVGIAYNVGNSFIASIPYMIDFLMAGGLKSVGTTLAKKYAKSKAGKIAVRIGGDLAGSAGIANTFQATQILADTQERKLGEQEITPTFTDGVINIEGGKFENSKSYLRAFAEAETAAVIENYSEMVGEYFKPLGVALGKGLGKVGRGAAKVIGKENWADNAGNILKAASDSDFATRALQLFEKTGYHGVVGEFSEEQVNMFLNAATVGDTKWEDITNPETQLTTFLSVGLMGGIASTVKTVGFASEYRKAQKLKNEALSLLESHDQTKYTNIVEYIDGTSVENLPSLLNDIMSDTDVDNAFKRDVLLYAYRQVYSKYFKKGLEQKAEDGQPLAFDENQSLNYGYALAEMDIKNQKQAVKDIKMVANKLGISDTSLEEIEQKAANGEDVTDLVKLYNLNQIKSGLYFGLYNQKEVRKDRYTTFLDNISNNGIVEQATLSNGKSVYIKRNNPYSDYTFVVDNNTTEMIPTSSITSRTVFGTISDVKATAFAEIENEYIRNTAEINAPEQTETGEPTQGFSDEAIFYIDQENIPARLVSMTANGATFDFGREVTINGNTSQIHELTPEQYQSIVVSHANPNPAKFTDETTAQTEVAEETPIIQYPTKEDGSLDFDNFTQEQSFKYIEETEGADAAITVLQKEIAKAESAVKKAQQKVDNAGLKDRPTAVSALEARNAELAELQAMLPESTTQSQEIVETVAEEPTTTEETPKYPTKANGELDFDNFTRQQAFDYTSETDGPSVAIADLEEDIKDTEAKIKKAETSIKKSKGVNKIKAREKVNMLNAELAQLKEMLAAPFPTQQEFANSQTNVDFSDTQPQTGLELAALFLQHQKLLYADYKRETGYSDADAKSMVGQFATKENGGVSIERAGELLELYDSENGTTFFRDGGSNEGRNAIIEMLSIARTRGDLYNYIPNQRSKQQSEYQFAELQAFEESLGMTIEDYDTYLELMEQESQLYNQYYDEINAIFVEESINQENQQNNERENNNGYDSSENIQPNQRGETTDIQGELPESATDGTISQQPQISELGAGDSAGEQTSATEGDARGSLPLGDGTATTGAEQSKTELVQSVIDKLGLPDITVISDFSEIPSDQQQAAKAITNGQSVKGWYDPTTGNAYIYAPNSTDATDVEATILHEVVAHKGLRELLGNKFDSLCDGVWRSMSKQSQNDMIAYVIDSNDPVKISNAKKSATTRRAAADEYMAFIAEHGIHDATVYETIKEFIRSLAKALGITSTVTDADIANILRASYANLKDGNLVNATATAQQSDQIQETLSTLSEKLNTPVNTTTIAEITNEEIRQAAESGAKAYYDVNTGEVTIITDNTLNASDAKISYLHEVVAHKGVREVLGSEFSNIMRSIFNGMSQAKQKAYFDNHGDIEVAAEEYLADLAGNHTDKLSLRTAWNSIIGKLRRLMRKLYNVNYTTADAEYLISQSAGRLQADKAKELLDNATNSRRVVAPEVRYRTSSPAALSAAVSYNNAVRTVNNLGFKVQEAYQDKMLALKEMQASISSETGKAIQDFENAYEQENQSHSAIANATDVFTRDYINPIYNELSKLYKLGYSQEEIETYLYIKTALDRNLTRAIELSGGSQTALDAIAKSEQELYNEYVKGKITYADYIARRAEVATEQLGESFTNAYNQDYSGLSSLITADDMRICTIQALAKIDRTENDLDRQGFNANHLFDLIIKHNQAVLNVAVNFGILSKAEAQSMKNRLRFYMPLRGFTEDTASDVFEYFDSGSKGAGQIFAKMDRRTSLADSPLATMFNLATRVISQGYRNRVKQAFYSMAINHDTSLLTVSKQWYMNEGTAERPKWVAQSPSIPVDATPEQVQQAMADFEADMLSAQAEGRASQEKGTLNIGYSNTTKSQEREHQVRVKINGEDYIVYVNGSPRAAQAINGTNISESSGLAKKITTGTRYLSSMYTTYSPSFALKNLVRDSIYASTSVMIKEKGMYPTYFKYYWKTVGYTAAGLVRWGNKGTLNMNDKLQRYYSEFLENGGETGFANIASIEKYKKEIKRLGKSKNPFRAVFALMRGANRRLENINRIAMYATSRDSGRSIQQAITDAKNISVNFNRKGAGGFGAKYISAGFAFTNAAIQGTYNFYSLIKNNPKKSAFAMSTLAALPYIMQALQYMLWDDDELDEDYANLSEWTRMNNICIYKGNGQFITIPLPIEYRVVYGMGEIGVQAMQGNLTPSQVAVKALENAAQLLPINFMDGVVGSDGIADWALATFTPTTARPIIDLYRNRSYFGTPILNENKYNENMPTWTKAFKSTSQQLVSINKSLSEALGGDDAMKSKVDYFLNPAAQQYLFQNYLGGLASFATDISSSVNDYQGATRLPLIKGFFSVPGTQASQRKINANYAEIDNFYTEINRRANYHKSHNQIDKYADIMNKHATTLERWKFADSEIRKLYKLRTEYQNVDAETESIDSLINFHKKSLIDALDDNN